MAVRCGKRRSDNPTAWSPEFTTDLLNLLNVLGRLVELEPAQADLLARVLAATQVTVADLSQAGVLPVADGFRKAVKEAAEAGDDDQIALV
jgi:hypothetical protein